MDAALLALHGHQHAACSAVSGCQQFICIAQFCQMHMAAGVEVALFLQNAFPTSPITILVCGHDLWWLQRLFVYICHTAAW